MDEKIIDAFFWIGTTGNCFISVHWDPEQGNDFVLEQSDIDLLEPEFQEEF